jgi:bifunctional non-homologous end joining protein LigD
LTADKKTVVQIDGRKITLTNLNKVLYPKANFTKALVIDYYTRVSSYLLPHLQDQPVTLKRFPNGINAEFFYEKNAPKGTPDWIRTYVIPWLPTPYINYIVINDSSTLIWLSNAANLEIHPFLHRVPAYSATRSSLGYAKIRIPSMLKRNSRGGIQRSIIGARSTRVILS